MNNSTEQQTETKTTRIQVGDLPKQEQELKNQEAQNIKGGGGPSGGVIEIHAGEEIPQKNRH